jgi:hypothetical protein
VHLTCPTGHQNVEGLQTRNRRRTEFFDLEEENAEGRMTRSRRRLKVIRLET